MAESLEQSIVSLLEEHVELAISTVQELRADKLELEAEIARLNNEVAQRDAHIQRLEERNRDLEEELNLERLAISQERTDVRERLEGLMNVLAASNEVETVPEMDFTIHNQEPNTAFARSTEDPEEE
ncbi:MAG: hypothetical protein OXU36_24630 [Candidatus Poribacteria bacterium]|nr:hypothetical protein [Candidatus Poribacteria bacterium]